MEIYTFEPQDEEDRTYLLAETNGMLLFYVDLEVSWGDGSRSREVRFSTVRSILAGMVE